MSEKITVKTILKKDIRLIWQAWTSPEHIVNWNFASDDWQCLSADNDLKEGGVFSYRMEAKDGNMGFDFSGRYTHVDEHRLIEFDLDDGRHVKIKFTETSEGVKIIETFETEKSNSEDMQRQGWQAILNNFKKYTEDKNE